MISQRTTATRTTAAARTAVAAAALPTVAGAYVLAIRLDKPFVLRLAGRVAVSVSAGRYLYCGSARGPGGLRARIARHLRRRKTLRWHVDRLTTKGRVIAVWAVPDGDECALAAQLGGLPVPVPGFGSSDCASCPSHLFAWAEGTVLPFGPPTVFRD